MKQQANTWPEPLMHSERDIALVMKTCVTTWRDDRLLRQERLSSEQFVALWWWPSTRPTSTVDNLARLSYSVKSGNDLVDAWNVLNALELVVLLK